MLPWIPSKAVVLFVSSLGVALVPLGSRALAARARTGRLPPPGVARPEPRRPGSLHQAVRAVERYRVEADRLDPRRPADEAQALRRLADALGILPPTPERQAAARAILQDARRLEQARRAGRARARVRAGQAKDALDHTVDALDALQTRRPGEIPTLGHHIQIARDTIDRIDPKAPLERERPRLHRALRQVGDALELVAQQEAQGPGLRPEDRQPVSGHDRDLDQRPLFGPTHTRQPPAAEPPPAGQPPMNQAKPPEVPGPGRSAPQVPGDPARDGGVRRTP